MLQRGPMPPKDGSNNDSESKKTKKWTLVPHSPPEEDARDESVPKLPTKTQRSQKKKKLAAKVAVDAQELQISEEKPEKPSKGRIPRRPRPGATRGGQPAAKKADQRCDAKQEDETQKMQKVPDGIKAEPCCVSSNDGEEQGDSEAVLNEADYSEVDEIPERLFRCFFSQRTDMQAFVGTMRVFQNASDKAMQRIHHLVITMLLDDFQSFPYWPEKELLMVGELLGQFIRWDLIPDGGPLQLALCCILSALKEPPASLLYRFGQRAVEQFLCRFAHHDVASQICRQMQQSQRPPHEEEVKQEERRLHVNPTHPVNPMNPLMFPAQPTVFLPWPLLPSLNQQHLLMRMLIPQAYHGLPSSSCAHHTGRLEGSQRVSQQEFPKWMLGNPSKAASRPAGSKQGILGWQEPEKEKREKEKDAGTKSKKRTSAKNKKASAGQNAGLSVGTTPLPSFIEVDMESMEFQLSVDDLLDVEVEFGDKSQEEENKEENTTTQEKDMEAGEVHP